MSRAHAAVKKALETYLKPKLAADSAFSLDKAVAGITKENFGQRKGKLERAIKRAKLAQDADVSDLPEMLDDIEDVVDEIREDVVGGDPDPTREPDTNDSADSLRATLKEEGFSDEQIEQVMSMPRGDKDDEPGAADSRRRRDRDRRDTKEPVTVTKAAMDAAVKVAQDSAFERATKLQSEIREAERTVRPYVGEIAVACDSAEDVYRSALKTLGLGDKVKDVRGAQALSVILSMQPKIGDRPERRTLAADSKPTGTVGFLTRFPEAERIKIG